MRREHAPDERFRAALRAADEPGHPDEARLWRRYTQGVTDDAIERVVDVYEDVFERELLQAWIFAKADDKRIIDSLGLSIDVLGAYKHLCCNLSMFRDELERLRWIDRYNGTPKGRQMLLWATQLDGAEAIAHLMGQPSKLDARHVQEQVMRDAFFRGTRTLRANNIASAEAQQAHSLMKTAAGAASLIDGDKGGEGGISDTLAKLKYRDQTHAAGAVVPPGEILH